MKLAAPVSRHITHIHSTAPGPPRKIAPATPETLPVPTRAAAEIENAWKALSDLVRSRRSRPLPTCSRCAFWVIAPNIAGIIRSCTAPERIVKERPSSTTTGIPAQVHSQPSAFPRNSFNVSRGFMTTTVAGPRRPDPRNRHAEYMPSPRARGMCPASRSCGARHINGVQRRGSAAGEAASVQVDTNDLRLSDNPELRRRRVTVASRHSGEAPVPAPPGLHIRRRSRYRGRRYGPVDDAQRRPPVHHRPGLRRRLRPGIPPSEHGGGRRHVADRSRQRHAHPEHLVRLPDHGPRLRGHVPPRGLRGRAGRLRARVPAPHGAGATVRLADRGG